MRPLSARIIIRAMRLTALLVGPGHAAFIAAGTVHTEEAIDGAARAAIFELK
jgi:hypothetical protein